MARTSFSFVAVLLLGLAACQPPPPTDPSMVNAMYVLDLNGHVGLTKNGQLKLELDAGNCTRYHDVPHPYGGVQTTADSCVPFDNDGWRTLKVRTPWGKEILATSGGPYWAAFEIDWSESGIDPLGKDAAARAAQPWKFDSPHAADPVVWTPDEEEAEILLELVGQAIGVEMVVEDVKAPARLEVTEARFSGQVRDGAAADLVVTVKNGGDGDAFRVLATTRSTVQALHGQRLGFGKIASGASKTRRLRVQLPREHKENEAVIVLSFSEAHSSAPAPFTLRVPILPAADVAQLALACSVANARSARVTVDAGQPVQIVCELTATGARAKGVQVNAQLAGQAASATPFDLEVGAKKSVSLPLVVPQGATMDSELVVSVTAKDSLGAGTSTSLTLVVARPNICSEGKLSRDAFEKKRAELRRALENKYISREEYERYEAELVGCMEAD
jgi:hypothetical protein